MKWWEVGGPLLGGILAIVIALVISRKRDGVWAWDLKKKYGIPEEDKEAEG